jgi:hypothetical protein
MIVDVNDNAPYFLHNNKTFGKSAATCLYSTYTHVPCATGPPLGNAYKPSVGSRGALERGEGSHPTFPGCNWRDAQIFILIVSHQMPSPKPSLLFGPQFCRLYNGRV